MKICEENFLNKVWTDLRDNLTEFLAGNLVLAAGVIPVVLLGLAGLWLPGLLIALCLGAPWLTALLGLAGDCAQGKVMRLANYAVYFRRDYKSSVLLWSPLGLLMLSGGLMWEMISFHHATWLAIPLGLWAGLTFVLILLIMQAATLLAIYHLPVMTCFRYSLLLNVKYRRFAIGLASFTVLGIFLISWSKMALLLIFPAVWAVSAVNMTLLELEFEAAVNQAENGEGDIHETKA